ncbi:MAG: large-conductance mechanosensitive channel protein MscL [Alphaproteobacteria bacterium]|nr:large-conductance mechanosensitive channel protein MscL [Alphaproteobacteria bacterium]
MFKEFRDFAMRGNVVDLAIGVIIGAAFGAIVSSLVNDIIMPIIGFATGGMDFSRFVYTLAPARPGPDGAELAAVTINYGKFVNYVLTFVIIAFALFVVVKGMNQLRKAEAPAPDAPPEPSGEEKLLTEIRDLIRAKM